MFSKPFHVAPLFLDLPCEHRIHQSRSHGTRAMMPTLMAVAAKKLHRKEILEMSTEVANMLPGTVSNRTLGGCGGYRDTLCGPLIPLVLGHDPIVLQK